MIGQFLSVGNDRLPFSIHVNTKIVISDELLQFEKLRYSFNLQTLICSLHSVYIQLIKYKSNDKRYSYVAALLKLL